MKTIPVRPGLVALVDDDDYERLAAFTWYLDSRGYVRRNSRRNGKAVFMHREVLLVASGVIVDHVNGEVLDNRRTNLRDATPAQNSMNRRPNRDKSSPFKGVCFDKKTGKWQACLRGRYLGQFASEEEAARIYDAAAREAFGDYAWLNFPDGMEAAS